MKPLDNTTLEAIAELICGDNGPHYRTGRELPVFFENAGLRCPPHDGSTRKWWTLERLKEYNKDPSAMEKIIKRLANPKEYAGDLRITQNVIDKLNQILSVEGIKVELKGVTPILREITPTLIEKKKRVIFPTPDFSAVIDDAILSEILKNRWSEVTKCIESGAYLAAIIMMGSILEGALFSVILKYPEEANQAKTAPKDKEGKVKKFWEWSLSNMINVAHELGWLEGDVREFSHTLRDYRNMVHPWHQMTKGETPDEDTCKICWQVVVAAINDLIKHLGKR